MREIKFRAKDRATGQWVYGFPYKSSMENWFILTPTEKFHIHEETLGQYTGLKDKEQKGIYEGDKVKFYDDIEDELIIGTVIYDSDTCSFCVESKVRETVSLTAYWQWEVVGNIHEPQ